MLMLTAIKVIKFQLHLFFVVGAGQGSHKDLQVSKCFADGVEQSTNVIFSVIMYSTNGIKGLVNAHIKNEAINL